MKLALLVATPLFASASPMDAPVEYGAIVKVECGNARGTGFHLGGGRYVTADHVTRGRVCAIAGVPVAVVRTSEPLDISELHGLPIPDALELNCRGVKAGRVYRSVGWGQMNYRLTLPLIATRNRDADSAGLNVMVGTIERGMSGGPVIDAKGKVVALNNRHSPARVRALSDTWICGG